MSVNQGTETGRDSTSDAGQSIGAQLVAARKARKLDPEKVALELKLDVAMIRALEQDNQAALPAPIFVKGYLRGYARLVGLPEEELVQRYVGSLGDPPPLTIRRVSTPRRRVGVPGFRLLRNLVLALLLGIMIWMAWPTLHSLVVNRGEPEAEQQQGQLELPPAITR